MQVMRFHIYTLQRQCEYLASRECKQMYRKMCSNLKDSSLNALWG
jgi:hypothetical protein